MTLLLGDCLIEMSKMESNSVELIYLDPPFFTQRKQRLKGRENNTEYTFEDTWNSMEDYIEFMRQRLKECRRVLKDTGSIFLHCDKSASHYLRVLLDEIFGAEHFQSEIIWSYRRWSNAKKGLLNSHQNIYFYSKSKNFTFHTLYTSYSEATNIDQILQERVRDEDNKSTYKRDAEGNVVLGKEKKGVPLSDVWEIPFLNPKAKERVGYPTQKPILLLERIIQIATNEGDTVLDPFCGSGTTLVAAQLLNRKYIGIDQLEEAINLARSRLTSPIKTSSALLKKGRASYNTKTEKELHLLGAIGAVPVQRNKGIDGFLSIHYKETPIAVRIQKENESLSTAKEKLLTASRKKGCILKILIRTQKEEEFILFDESDNKDVLILDEHDLLIKKWIESQEEEVATYPNLSVYS